MTSKRIIALLCGIVLIAGVGCKKAPEPEATVSETAEAPAEAAAAPAEAAPEAPPPAPIPPLQGAADVKAALNRKDYMAAVQLLGQVKANASQDQLPDYTELARIVQESVVQDMATNPNAKQAYEVLRFVMSGR